MLLILFFLIIIMLYLLISGAKKAQYRPLENQRKKYSDDENEYRDKVKVYIQDHIDALLWYNSTVKPSKSYMKTDFQNINTEEFFIESGGKDISCQHFMVDQYMCTAFKILGKTILVVSDDHMLFSLSDSKSSYNNNIIKLSSTLSMKARDNLYIKLEHDIPTIALVYIEHYIRNCVDEKEKYYQNLPEKDDDPNLSQQTVQHVNEIDEFNLWEKEATSYFVNKYKDEYNLDSPKEEDIIIEMNYIDENQIQNG